MRFLTRCFWKLYGFLLWIIRTFGTKPMAMFTLAFPLAFGFQRAIRHFYPSKPADNKENETFSDGQISDKEILLGKIDGLKRDILEKERQLAALTRDLEASTYDARRYEQQIFKLKEDISRVEAEKQDALTRLSALMSVKLRDNNPNIADLSDQFRPTKLAEMFSELYDNEWTDAFTALNSVLTDRQTITFLLDILMDAYFFCSQELEMKWRLVSDWYLDDTLPNKQQIQKLLKDSRKVAVVKMVQQVSEQHRANLHSVCAVQELHAKLSTAVVGNYVQQSVKLCLLMCANDPPVVIECQDRNSWVSTFKTSNKNSGEAEKQDFSLQTTDEHDVKKEQLINEKTEENADKQLGGEKPNLEEQVSGEGESTIKYVQNNLEDLNSEDESNNEDKSNNAEHADPENKQLLPDKSNTEGIATREFNTQIENNSVVHGDFTRQLFERDVFKEYTTRGPYLEYVVWPVMYLHQGGPMLGKGVAQGTREAVGRGEEEQWTWKKTE